MSFRSKLIEVRKAKGWTQQELAAKCNVTTRTIQRIESGSVEPRTYTMRVISNTLGMEYFESEHQAPRSLFWQFKDLFNFKTNKMKKISILSAFALLLVLATFFIQAQSPQNSFEKVDASNIDQDRLAFAENISQHLLEAQRNDSFYELKETEATDQMINGLNESTQRQANAQLQQLFGDYQGMEFKEMMRSTDAPVYEIYRFKGDFTKNQQVEVRAVLNEAGKLAGFFVRPWRDTL